MRAQNADAIDEDLRNNGPVVVPAYFEADAYAGIRRMLLLRKITRENAAEALTRLAGMDADRVALAPLLPHAYELVDRVGAHDAFYVVLARGRNATLLTSDGPLANAAEQLRVSFLFRPTEAIG